MEDNIKKDRAGYITASNFATFVKKDKSGNYFLSNSETATNLIYKIAWERLVIDNSFEEAYNRLNVDSAATNHGNMYEAEAVMRFQEKTGLKVDYYDQFHIIEQGIGGTPDGYIDEDGLIEIKCPWNGGNHLRTLLTGEIYNKDYYIQMQGYLWITGRKYCKFVTYDPDLPEDINISITHVDRDEDVIEGIKLVIRQVRDQLKEIQIK